MRLSVSILAAFLVFLAGCVTMPDPVPDEYLAEKTAEQEKSLEKLENFVIAKNHAARVMKEKLHDAEQKLKVEKGRLGILRDEKKLLEEKQKQYKLENDGEKVDETANLIARKDSEIRAQASVVDHVEALRDLAIAEKDVADADLSVQVAELRYERARIARDYLMSRLGTADAKDKKDSSEAAEKYDEKYRVYLEKQKKILLDKKEDREEAAVKVRAAEDKLVK